MRAVPCVITMCWIFSMHSQDDARWIPVCAGLIFGMLGPKFAGFLTISRVSDLLIIIYGKIIAGDALSLFNDDSLF